MTPKKRTIQIRVTPDQYERIKNKAYAKGYTTLTSFILRLALEKDLVFEQRFEEVHKILTKLHQHHSLPLSDKKRDAV